MGVMYQGATVDRKRNPRERAGLFRVFAFLYTVDIFRKARHRDLIEDDLYEPLPDFGTSFIGDRLEFEWQKEKEIGRNSLTRALMRVFGRTYILCGIAALFIKTTLATTTPLLVGRLVSYFAPDSTMTQETVCIYGGLLLLSGFIQSAFDQHYQLMMAILGLKIKASIVSLLYRTSLRLTSASLMKLTSGKLVTLVNKDAGAFETAVSRFHDLWIGVIQLFIVNYVMYQQIQEASFVGVALLLVLIPVQVILAKYTKITRLKMAAKTDERLKLMQEILTSIKLLKLYNWGGYYTKLTNNIRIQEMSKLRIIFYLKSCVMILSQISDRLSFYLCIMFYIYQDNFITAEKTFIIIGCYHTLRMVLTISVPWFITQFAEARSAMKRIKEALLIENVPESSNNINDQEVKVIVKGATVDFLGQRILSDINLQVRSPSLIAITGNVGSGKSTMLKMLLNEIYTESGNVHVNGTVSYASQDPWLFPGTIRENILFGQSFNSERYQEVVRRCALIQDLESFPMKDNTVVNDKGLNLSKGQQARINLARAVYKEADIYLLDDVMVSLDATVSKYIFENCFQGLLKAKLVVFVCHNKKYLKLADKILVLNKGSIQAEGKYKDLKNLGIEFTVDTIDSTIETQDDIRKKSEKCEKIHEEAVMLTNTKHVAQRLYLEGKEEGKVKLCVYKAYLDSAGGWLVLVGLLMLFTCTQTFQSYFDYYIQTWLKVEESMSRLTYNISMNYTNVTFDSDTYEEVYAQHLGTIYTYSFLMGMAIVSVSIQLFIFFGLATKASKFLHNSIFTKVTNATMNFFDQNLSGNILNRFSKDMGTIDEYLPYVVYESFRVLFFTVGISTVISVASPILILPTLIMITLMLLSRKSFLVASRGLKRLDGMTRAPVVGYLNSSLEGLTTIRASGNQTLLIRQFERHQDLNTSTLYMYFSIAKAFGFWLDCMCKVYVALVIYSSIFMSDRGEGSGGKVGLIITQAFGMMGLLQWGIRQWAELENQMTCVERLNEYSDTEQEKHAGVDPDSWPLKGHIEYRNVCMTYFTGKPVLTNVNFEIFSGERVGIVGRTGAGKSSIISALFRLYNIKGSITIDEFDIRDVELPIVRSKISIIPQDPVLFAGTIRTNLDPDGQHTDMQLWNTLEKVELKKDVECLSDGLSTVVQEGGGNFSVGQRQLICLARAVLRDNKILVLDEATANIDPTTDALIQKTIRRLFSHCTILTIAHRLHTVIDSDRILVVDNGEVIDFDTPRNLVQRGSGPFYNMAKQVGLADQFIEENQKDK